MEKVSNDIPFVVKVKKEQDNDDIKEFAETTMNELLGWYGYGNSKEESRQNRQCRSQHGSHSSGSGSPKFIDPCGWCGKVLDEASVINTGSAVFCSELCFSQSRRANFKKNKTCDWCRHVRNTVMFIESQDGTSQLQFCSDKCLNQYKMHIFCRETQAHLEMHPYMKGDEFSSGTLITPDLWLKNCKSPSVDSTTSSPLTKAPEPQTSSSMPLITVAHPSKLMKPIDSMDAMKKNRHRHLRKNKKRCVTMGEPSLLANNVEMYSHDSPQDLRVRHTPDSRDLEMKTNHSDVNSRSILENTLRFTPPSMRDCNPPINPNLNNHFTQNLPLRKPMESFLPPPTILLPYPIILPLPIPVPIPIPINGLDFMRKEQKDESSQTEESCEDASPSQNGEEESNSSMRLLRRRKRLFDITPKAIKNKKPAHD